MWFNSKFKELKEKTKKETKNLQPASQTMIAHELERKIPLLSRGACLSMEL